MDGGKQISEDTGNEMIWENEAFGREIKETQRETNVEIMIHVFI